MIFDSLNLHKSGQAYYFEPTTRANISVPDILSINVQTGQLSIIDSIPKINYNQPKLIYGLIGMIRLSIGLQVIIIKKRKRIGQIRNHIIYKIIETDILPCTQITLAPFTHEQIADEEKYLSLLRTFLKNAELYYSTSLDLTRSLQAQFSQDGEFASPSYQKADLRFFSNHHVQSGLIEFSQANPSLKAVNSYIIPCIEGFVGSFSCFVNKTEVTLTLVSRRQWLRSGTRYHSRGMNQNGFVSNFVETEQVLSTKDDLASFVQFRGSIPLFWRQSVNLQYSPPFEVSRHESTLSIMKRHFEQLLKHHSSVTTISLVNGSGRESLLGKEFAYQLNRLKDTNVKYIHFDFHRHCGTSHWENLSLLVKQISSDIDNYGYFCLNASQKVVSTQSGIFRSNCIDCLDRTNVVQSLISKIILGKQLKNMHLLTHGEIIDGLLDLGHHFRALWADNADALSLAYAGTGAQKTDYTRTGHRSIVGVFSDLNKSAMRYFYGNFFDATRQDSMDLFYGKYIVSNKSPSPFKKTHKHSFYLILGMFILSTLSLIGSLLYGKESVFGGKIRIVSILFFFLSLRNVIKNGRSFVIVPSLASDSEEAHEPFITGSIKGNMESSEKGHVDVI